MSDSPPTKRCSKCGETKAIEDFHKHKDKKDGRQTHCKTCRSTHAASYSPAYYAANAEVIREKSRAYRVANPDKVYETNRRYRSANADKRRKYQLNYAAADRNKIRDQQKRYRMLNRDKERRRHRLSYAINAAQRRESRRLYRQTHIDQEREYSRRYHQAHPEIARASRHLRRARMKANGGKVTAKELAAKRSSQNGLCAYCRMPHDPQELTIDHVIPIRQGGPHIIANIVFACGICNSSKGNRTPEQWTDRWYERK